MHFGKRLDRDLVERWRPHYLQYKLLKKHIKEMQEHLKSGSLQKDSSALQDDGANGLLANQQISYQEFSFPGPKAHRFNLLSSFKPILDKEVEKINVFTTSKVAEIQNRILQILRLSPPWKNSQAPLDISDVNAGEIFLEHHLAEASTIAQEIIDIDKFIRQNCIAIQKIVKKFDKKLQFDIAPWLNAQLMENEPFLKVNLDALMIALSDAFEKLNLLCAELKTAQGLKKEDDGKKGISAQSFERKTTKYWVRSENIMAIKVAILKNLPIYLFDRKEKDGNGPRENFKTKNFLRDFGDLYGSMSDSAPITSIYLDNDELDVYRTRLTREEGAQLFRLRWYGDAKSLPEKDYVFFERKTHHESWVSAKSVKERFPIKTKNVQAFFEGKFSAAESMKKWMKPDSKGLKLLKNDDELQKAVVLSSETFSSIQKRKLKPMVRTLYRRTAFQARDHNEVRISIDTHLMMVNENVTPASGNEYPWCRDMINSNIPPSDILQFPYCILEVKLNCDNPPTWITSLLADTHTVIECPKFSKFLTGIAYHQYQKIPELPYWFKDQVAIDPRNRFMSEEERERLIYRDTAVQFEEKLTIELSPSNSVSTLLEKKEGKKPEVTYTSIDMGQDLEHEGNDESTPLMKHLGRDGEGSSTNFSQRASTQNLPHAGSSIFSTLRNRFLGKSGVIREGRDEKKPLKPVRSSDRIKIEPKTSFANERTLIQWVSAASLMITLATLIMTSGSDLGFAAGFVFFPLAFVIMLYAIIRYQYRAWSFRNRRNAYHDDLYGPVFLVIAIASAMGVIMFLMFYYNTPIPVTIPRNVPLEGCEILNSNGLESYFPFSDVALVGNEVVAVGPFAVASFASDAKTWSKTVFPDQQISAIVSSTLSADVIYLGVEKPTMQIVHYTKSTKEMNYISLDKISRSYNITLKALAILQEDTQKVAFLIGDENGSLFQLEVPKPLKKNSTAQLVSVVPGSRLAKGLVDDYQYKRISGMFLDAEFERLYVLFGRSRRMRIFNTQNYTMINEWYMPGTSFQWSGVALTPANTEGTRYALLSQSIPGAVWKFKLTKEAVELNSPLGQAFYPCAETFDGDLVQLMIVNPGDKLKRKSVAYVSDY